MFLFSVVRISFKLHLLFLHNMGQMIECSKFILLTKDLKLLLSCFCLPLLLFVCTVLYITKKTIILPKICIHFQCNDWQNQGRSTLTNSVNYRRQKMKPTPTPPPTYTPLPINSVKIKHIKQHEVFQKPAKTFTKKSFTL